MMKLDGKQLATNILENLTRVVEKLKSSGITPTMAIILIGSDPNSLIYIKQKGLKAESIGAETKLLSFDEATGNDEIEKLVVKLNNDKNIHGLIIQRPTPPQIKINELSDLINPVKEIDGFGKNSIYPVPVAQASLKLIEEAYKLTKVKQNFNDWLKNQNVVVIGKGETAGRPIINLLQKFGVNPKVVDSKTENPDKITNSADILVSSVGKENFVTPKKLKKGVILIGVGLTKGTSGKLVGDYDEEKIKKIASFYSPTPGGVGPVNVSCLMENLVAAAKSLA